MASQQTSEVEWMREQMAQMRAMMEQMSQTRVEPQELGQQREHERKMAEIQLQIAEARARAPSADLSSIRVVQKENKVAEFR